MSVRPILLWPDPRLSQVCDPVDPTHASALITDLFDTMYAATGRGLAAPQIGVMARVFVTDVTWKDGARTPMAFLNPELQHSCEESGTLEEGCLSIPDLPMPVTRPDRITLRWTTPEGHTETRDFDGPQARCILHELDHLNGKVIFDHQSPEARAELEARYAH